MGPNHRAVVRAALILAVLQSCASPRVAATEPVAAPRVDPRVEYEPGSERLALEVSRHIDGAITKVERFHGFAFRKPVRFFTFATRDSFKRHAVFAPRWARASTRLTAVYFNQKLDAEIDTTRAVVTHELAHALIGQHMGFVRATLGLPTWFKEGLATLAANGGGAEGITEAEAHAAILDGPTFAPNATGGWGHPAARMQSRLFYCQAWLFLAHLHDPDPGRFRGFLRELRHESFPDAFVMAFGMDLNTAWEEFRKSIAEERD